MWISKLGRLISGNRDAHGPPGSHDLFGISSEHSAALVQQRQHFALRRNSSLKFRGEARKFDAFNDVCMTVDPFGNGLISIALRQANGVR